jgi:hypothetical protein
MNNEIYSLSGGIYTARGMVWRIPYPFGLPRATPLQTCGFLFSPEK